jgi:hypothetical protein
MSYLSDDIAKAEKKFFIMAFVVPIGLLGCGFLYWAVLLVGYLVVYAIVGLFA